MKASNNENRNRRTGNTRKSKPILAVDVGKRLKQYYKNGVYFNLNKLLGDPYFLIACYEDIKNKPGNMTGGIYRYTFDGLSGE